MKDAAGKAVLVNADMISAIRQADGKDNGVVLTMGGEDIEFPQENIGELRKKLSEDTSERIASNLFHIWEILRARLH